MNRLAGAALILSLVACGSTERGRAADATAASDAAGVDFGPLPPGGVHLAVGCLGDGGCEPGTCPAGFTCNTTLSIPACQQLGCATVGQACQPGSAQCAAELSCTAEGACCAPQCDGIACGSDGCGGQCGTCAPFMICAMGSCVWPPKEGFELVELHDDPNNQTVIECDAGTIKSPGSDIDAAELQDASGAVVASLETCVLTDQGSCQNDRADASKAEATPDSDGSEEQGAYVSLNNGWLGCRFSDGRVVSHDDTLTVFEVGAAVENYRVRFCEGDGTGCTIFSNYGTGKVYIPASMLF